MHEIGDLIIYPGHGICRVDDIYERELAGNTKTYYLLHPMENNQNLTLHLPTDSNKIVLYKLINKEEAKQIMELLATAGTDWIENPNQRVQTYTKMVNTGQRKEIAKVVTTLLRKKHDIEHDGKKFYESDSKLLTNIQDILYKELALAFDTSTNKIDEMVDEIVNP